MLDFSHARQRRAHGQNTTSHMRAQGAHQLMPNGNGTNNDGGNNDANDRSDRTNDRNDRERGSNRSRNDGLIDEMREMMTTMLQGNNVSQREQTLIRDNFKLRRRNATLRDDLDAAGKGKVPEGSVVVKKEDADELAKFRALKLTPEVLTTSITELAKLKTESAERANESVHEEAAEALGYPNVAALSKALKREGLHVEMKSARVDDPDNAGKKITVAVPHVRKASDEKAALEPLADYIDRELSEFVPAFSAEPEADDEDDDESSTATRVTTVPMKRASNTNGASKGGGVSIAVARGVTKPNGPAREQRQADDALAKKKQSGAYSL